MTNIRRKMELSMLKQAIKQGLTTREQLLAGARQGMEARMKRKKLTTVTELCQEIVSDTEFLSIIANADITIEDFQKMAQSLLTENKDKQAKMAQEE